MCLEPEEESSKKIEHNGGLWLRDIFCELIQHGFQEEVRSDCSEGPPAYEYETIGRKCKVLLEGHFKKYANSVDNLILKMMWPEADGGYSVEPFCSRSDYGFLALRSPANFLWKLLRFMSIYDMGSKFTAKFTNKEADSSNSYGDDEDDKPFCPCGDQNHGVRRSGVWRWDQRCGDILTSCKFASLILSLPFISIFFDSCRPYFIFLSASCYLPLCRCKRLIYCVAQKSFI
jgi:hypothetical protein